MTYRHDSDIFIPHGTIRPHKGTKTEEWLQYDRDLFMRSISRRSIFFKNKAKNPGKVAWVSSHCYTRQDIYFLLCPSNDMKKTYFFRSRRQLYVKELQKYINVSSFGACGQRCLVKAVVMHKIYFLLVKVLQNVWYSGSRS